MNEVSWKKSKRVFTKINDRKLTMPLVKDVKPQDIRNLRDLNFLGNFSMVVFRYHNYLSTKYKDVAPSWFASVKDMQNYSSRASGGISCCYFEEMAKTNKKTNKHFILPYTITDYKRIR